MAVKLVLEVSTSDDLGDSIQDVIDFVNAHPVYRRERVWVSLIVNAISDCVLENGNFDENCGSELLPLHGVWDDAFAILQRHIDEATREITRMAEERKESKNG